MKVKGFMAADLPEMIELWNEIVREGKAFPQEVELGAASGEDFFKSQSCCGTIRNESGALAGLYVLHPNNVGRCGHICNASYAVAKKDRGKGFGEKLVSHSLKAAKELGFRVMQFNAVAVSNIPARELYKKLGFNPLGIIPAGFRKKNGEWEDIQLFWRDLTS